MMNENNVNNGENNNLTPQKPNNLNSATSINDQNINFQQQPIEQPINGQQPNYNQQSINNPNSATSINDQNINFQQQPIEQPINSQQFDNNQPQNNNQQTMNNKNKIIKKILLIIIVIGVIIALVFAVKIFIFNENGNKKLNSLFSSDLLIKVKKNKKYGYIDSNGKFIIEPQYDYASAFHGKYAIVGLESNKSDLKVKKYQIIDKNNNVKATSEYSSDIQYIKGYNRWIINYQLYNQSLKKISSDDVSVSYEEYGYFSWINKSNNTAGIMNSSGKITYTYKLENDDSYIDVNPSNVHDTLKERYCTIGINHTKFGIVNCNTGKVVYDYIDNYILNEDDNIFRVREKETFEYISIMYIQNDKIIYQSSNEEVDVSYDSNGYVEIYDYNEEDVSGFSYIDLSTGNITDEKPDVSTNNKLDKWEKYSKITKFTCDNGYGLMSGKKVIIPCEWSNIDYFNLKLYKYLSSKGKEYVIAAKDNKKYLLNLKNGKIEAEFNTTYLDIELDIDSYSTFIYYMDSKTNKIIIYNLITGKSILVEDDLDINKYLNYITIKKDGKLNYYNMNLKLIYIEE